VLWCKSTNATRRARGARPSQLTTATTRLGVVGSLGSRLTATEAEAERASDVLCDLCGPERVEQVTVRSPSDEMLAVDMQYTAWTRWGGAMELL